MKPREIALDLEKWDQISEAEEIIHKKLASEINTTELNLVKWKRLLSLVEKQRADMTQEEANMPIILPRCKEDHPLTIDDNFYCQICEQQFYPADERNFYSGFDFIRERSILNNDKI